eukprot:Hpha_TRINITY_DN15851_c4_g1::TRINITY_DN15851_c4_g1_i2::g.191501::m.191501
MSEVVPAAHAGFLKKVGGGVMGRQQERYFELRGPFLFYYLQKPASASEKPRGRIDTTGTVISDEPNKDPFAFTISGPHLPRVYKLISSEARERRYWVDALKKASKRRKASGSSQGRQPPAQPAQKPEAQAGLALPEKLTKPQWEWQDDSTFWLLFDPADSDTIEGMYVLYSSVFKAGAGSTPFFTKDLTWNRKFQTQYQYDFSLMQQVNTDSKRVRHLRRTEVQSCSRGHKMTERDDSIVTCSYCCKHAASKTFHCSACEEVRCAHCAGLVAVLQQLTPEEFIRCFKRLSQMQIETLKSDTATSAMLKRDNLGVVWTSHSDVGRTFGEATGKNMTDVTLFAVPPASQDGRECEIVPFPAVRAPNYADPVDILPTTEALKFKARDLTGKLRIINLMQFLETIGEFIGGLGRSANWKDPIDATPMQQSTQFSIIPVPSGSTEVGVGTTGSRCTNLHIVIGPHGEIGWAPEKPGMQKIYFRDGKGEELRTIRLVPEKRKEVAKAFFKVQVRDETVEEERERYKNVENALLHLQIAMDGVPGVERVTGFRPSSYASASSPADQVPLPPSPSPSGSGPPSPAAARPATPPVAVFSARSILRPATHPTAGLAAAPAVTIGRGRPPTPPTPARPATPPAVTIGRLTPSTPPARPATPPAVTIGRLTPSTPPARPATP